MTHGHGIEGHGRAFINKLQETNALLMSSERVGRLATWMAKQ